MQLLKPQQQSISRNELPLGVQLYRVVRELHDIFLQLVLWFIHCFSIYEVSHALMINACWTTVVCGCEGISTFLFYITARLDTFLSFWNVRAKGHYLGTFFQIVGWSKCWTVALNLTKEWLIMKLICFCRCPWNMNICHLKHWWCHCWNMFAFFII